MEFFKPVKTFVAEEKGAVTVDWVVLTAALATIALIVVSIVSDGIYVASSDIAAQLTAVGK